MPEVLITGLTPEQLDEYEARAEQAMREALDWVMDQIADRLGRVGTASALVAHMPGRHNQQTHGRGGKGVGPGGGVDLIAGGQAEAIAADAIDAAAPYATERSELAGRLLYSGGGVGPHGDEALFHLAIQQGFDGPATAVSRAEMDTAIRGGFLGRGAATPMYRGVRPSPDGTRTAAQIHEQVRSGPAHYGLGFSGNGYYMSSSRSEASRYGDVARYALHARARVVDLRELDAEQSAYLASLPQGSAARRVFSDPGRYAAARGYDAIKWRRGEETGKAPGEEDEFIVLNRSALLAEAPS